MPSTVNDLLRNVGLVTVKSVKWGERIQCQEEGIYIVSLSPDPSKNIGTLQKSPISEEIVCDWIEKLGGFELDGLRTFDVKAVIRRMSEFWLPDENILYFGKAPKRSYRKGVGNRVGEYYKTDYGEAKPHAGGHWLKALKNLNELFVYYVETENCGEIEINMLSYFCENVSDGTRSQLRDKKLSLPFANLELKKGQRKNHGLNKMKKC